MDKRDEYELTNLVKDAFLSAKDGEDAQDIINALLTTDEKIKIGRRIKIARLLRAEISGEEIMGLLHVGRNSVTLVSKHIFAYPKGFSLIFERIKKVEQTYRDKKIKKTGGSTLVFKKKEYTGYKRKNVVR